MKPFMHPRHPAFWPALAVSLALLLTGWALLAVLA
jgi:hypothetical protein